MRLQPNNSKTEDPLWRICDEADEHAGKKINGSAENVFITFILAKNIKTN